ncbi:MAG: CoA transferase, partial [Chloroflexi bacterium]|nr:CoA transferase [Chloroflexota bacterium]
GVMSITGHPGGPPPRPGYSIGDMAGGMYTAIGVLAALHERESSGLGQHVDVAMLDAQVALLENAVVRAANTEEVPGPIGTRHPLVTPFQAFPTLDGWMVIAGVRDWQLFCAKIERDDLLHDERFQTNPDRTEHHADLEPILNEAFKKRTTAEWEAELEGVCIAAPMNSLPQIINDPHIHARGMIAELPVAKSQKSIKVSGSPVHLSRTPIHLNRGAAAIGEHTREALELIGRSTEEIDGLAEAGVVSLDQGDPQ